MKIFTRIIPFTFLALCFLPFTASASVVVVHAGLLYDDLAATPRKNVSVVIHDDPHAQLMTEDEVKSAVDTAHMLGMKVAAHAYPPAAIETAVRAGVDSIEHGSFATAETFALMKAQGTFLVPTLSVYDVFYKVADEHPELLTPGTAAKELANDLLPKRSLPLVTHCRNIGVSEVGAFEQQRLAGGAS
jgi:hypothetical protein